MATAESDDDRMRRIVQAIVILAFALALGRIWWVCEEHAMNRGDVVMIRFKDSQADVELRIHRRIEESPSAWGDRAKVESSEFRSNFSKD